MHSVFHTRSWKPDAFYTQDTVHVELATVQGLSSPTGPVAAAWTARTSTHTPLCLPAFGLLLLYQEEVPKDRPYLSGPRTQLKASNPRPPRAVELVLLDKGWTSCMWLGTGRKQGHYQGSMASGQRKRILGVIKVLTDKNCSRPLRYRKGTFIEGQTENISFRDLSRLHIPQPRTWLRVRAQ